MFHFLLFFCLLPFFYAQEFLNFDVIIDHKNLFDGKYKIYSPRNFASIFAYNIDSACLVYRDAYGIQAQLDSFKTFFASAKRLVRSVKGAASLKIEACFELERYSFLIFRDKTNRTSIIRGGNEKTLQLYQDYQKFIFDQVEEQLYLQMDGHILKINKHDLISWYTSQKPLEHRINVETQRDWVLSANISDVLIIDKNLYYIESGGIYRKINEKSTVYVSDINSKKFNFLIFPQDEEHIIISLSTDANLKTIFTSIIYFIEIMIVFILAYGLKKFVRWRKNQSYELQELESEVYPPLVINHAQNKHI